MSKLTHKFIFLTGLILLLAFAPENSEALLQQHLDYNGCNTCHKLHGAGSGFQLLAGVDTEATCLACHGPLNPFGIVEAVIHDPGSAGSGGMGYISCRECHDAHDNQGNNIKMLGYDWDPITDPGRTTIFPDPTIREELPGSDILNPVFQTVIYETRNDFNRGSNDGACQICHTAGPAAGAPTDLNNHQWGDCVICHGHSDGFRRRQCVACHDDNSTVNATAPKVLNKAGGSAAAVGSHLQAIVGETIVGLSDVNWTVQCIKCHTGHTGDVIVPNNTTVGIDYQRTGGIGLGGSATLAAATSEAEICWDCHSAEGVSEWGVNSDTNGGANNYDFGSISGPVAPAWVDAVGGTGATWNSANFGYKTGEIQSTHSVDNSAVAAGLDPVATIRCSYCHDVHDLNSLVTDNSSGKPYLRGTWMGSPYREDGAPQAGDSWTNNGNYGAVPRSGTQSVEMGGYQIDQNNGNPTTSGNPAHLNQVDPAWSLTNSAGLCTVCHGSDVDNMNQFGDPASAWIGLNGHANAAIGGSGVASGLAVNIFSMAIRNPSGAPLYTSRGSNRGYPRQSYGNAGVFTDTWPNGDNTNSYWGYGFRSQNSGGFRLSPRVTASRPYAYRAYNWGASVDNTLDDRYHKFSCSKCHSPHASRLPRLLITNCLDTKQNSWDDQASVSILGTSTTYAPENRGVTFAMATSAQNCHRLADTANYSNATGDGWNLVSPWTGGAQDNPGIP